MLFNSFEFLIFIPIVFLLYWLVVSRNVKAQNIFLIAISYFFYAWWDWRFLSLVLITTVSTYVAAYYINVYKNQREKGNIAAKWILIGTLILNIGILFFFKYYNFFVQSFIDAFQLFGKELSISTLKIILPIGISFFTFSALSYPIDVYKGKTAPTKDIIAFLAYVAFFPSLLSGPISRATTQLPQFFTKRVFNYENISEGMKLMLWGFFMKLCVADRLGLYVDAVYNNLPQHNGTSLALASFFYAFQLYADFGGYSLLAIGCGRLFGIKLLDNFIRPYMATSFAEYWKRNHISLTQWLMDYIYYPMVGQSDKLRWWNFSMIVTFLISGLWHGADWSFVMWGLYQGVFIVLSTNIAKRRKKFEKQHKLKNKRLYQALTILLIFGIVCFGLIFFRANSITDAFEVIHKVFTAQGSLFIDADAVFAGLLSLVILIFKDVKDEFCIKCNFLHSKHVVIRYASAIALMAFILSMGVLDGGQFIYFQF
jgi:D-alanyl-lipoteichoic acid acyltransferase DltB (MBOAT superfamily)